MKREILFLIVIFLSIFLGLQFVYALLWFGYDDPSYQLCKPPRLCGDLPYTVCINTYDVGVGACGYSGCAGGELWSKYTTTYQCKLVFAPTLGPLGSECAWIFIKTETWASIADKLQPHCQDQQGCGRTRDGYLAGGSCDPGDSGLFYKVCCDGDKVGNTEAPEYLQDRFNPPTEGTCANGARAERVLRPLTEEELMPQPGQYHPLCAGGGGGGGGGAPPPPGCPPGYVLCDDGQCWGGCPSGWRTECIPGDGAKCVAETPPPPPPPPASSQGLEGICSPVIVNRISYPNNPNQWSKEGQTSQLNSQLENSALVKKGDTLYLDAKLENRGTTATAQCRFIECTSEVQKACCLRQEEVWTPCCVKENQATGECITWGTCPTLQCVERGVYNECSGWSGEQTETISNPAVCRMSNNGVTIAFGFDILKKFFESTLNIANTFNVNPNSTINNGSVTLFNLDQWARSLGWNGNVNPQRHGYFYLKSEKTGGAIYNQPDVITRSDGSFSSRCVLSNPPSVIGARNYIACQECRWTGSGWSCPWSGDKGSYTIFDETATTDGRVNGTTPLNVEPGRIEFYTQPADVEPYLSVEKSQAPTPPSSQVKTPLKDWIAGYPFNITYGVNILGPGRFGNDRGNFWLELSGVLSFSGGAKSVSDSSTRSTLTFTPQKAGSLTITSKHNADDEKVSINENNEAIGNVESISTTITNLSLSLLSRFLL
jgi:hypothetical protein